MKKQTKVKINEIKSNELNPRWIKDSKFEKLVKSIKEFPEMLELRPIVVDENMTILGGNMRYKACVEAGLKEIPIIIANKLSETQKKEFIIKDNIGFGEWDWDILSNEWNVDELNNWSLDVPKWEDVSFNTEIEDTGEYDYPEDKIIQSHVKMVQLFLNTETEPNFRKWEEHLRKIVGTYNLTDTIYKSIEKLYNETQD
jgi:hypothetical protein